MSYCHPHTTTHTTHQTQKTKKTKIQNNSGGTPRLDAQPSTLGTSASKTPRQFGTPRQAHYNGLHEFPRALLALASSVMLEVSQLHDLDGAARLAEADRRMALIPSRLPGKVSARDVKECLANHPRTAEQYRAMRDDAAKCHREGLKAVVLAAETTAGSHVARLERLEEGMSRHRASCASTGHDEAAVESSAGVGVTKRMNALRRAGDKEARAAAAVVAEAAAVVAAAAEAAAAKRRAELAAVVEQRTMAQVTQEREEALALAVEAAANQVKLVETAVTLTGSVMTLAMGEVNEDLRAILMARAQGIADQIAERALANAWREEVAETIVEDVVEEAYREGSEAWAEQHADDMTRDTIEAETAEALVDDVVAESFE